MRLPGPEDHAKLLLLLLLQLFSPCYLSSPSLVTSALFLLVLTLLVLWGLVALAQGDRAEPDIRMTRWNRRPWRKLSSNYMEGHGNSQDHQVGSKVLKYQYIEF